ncbi:MAG: hypothetical protein KGL39_15145 [Patescibacteria group bacterium]|nr:hypothetical protein [Patescibacteria group bacterium]
MSVDGLPDVPEEMISGIGDAIEGVAPQTVEEPINQETPETPVTPEGQTPEEAATDAPDSFTKLDPNSLPEEVQPFYKLMLADYTRKQQEAAPWRKLGEDLGLGSPDDLRQAAELWSFLQDQNNVVQFYEQLGRELGQAQPATQGPETPAAGDEFSTLDDPALAQLRSEITAIREENARRDATQQREALQWALLGEMNRQQALIQEQHPDWGVAEGDEISDEWRAVWNLAPTFNGDVVKAAAVVEAVQNAGVTRLLNGKAAVAATEGLTAPGPARVAETPVELDTSDPELRAQTAAAVEMLRGIVNQSE